MGAKYSGPSRNRKVLNSCNPSTKERNRGEKGGQNGAVLKDTERVKNVKPMYERKDLWVKRGAKCGSPKEYRKGLKCKTEYKNKGFREKFRGENG